MYNTQRVNTVHIMCADCKESVLTFIQACFCKEVLQLLPLSSINFLSFFAKKHAFFKWIINFFPTWLFCLAKFWGPLNNLEGNLDKKQNRSWITCLKPFLHSFKKTKEIFQRSSKGGSRTFGADVTLCMWLQMNGNVKCIFLLQNINRFVLYCF